MGNLTKGQLVIIRNEGDKVLGINHLLKSPRWCIRINRFTINLPKKVFVILLRCGRSEVKITVPHWLTFHAFLTLGVGAIYICFIQVFGRVAFLKT